MIRKLGQNERFRFYTMLQKLVENKDGYVTNEERQVFWENVAFYNFIQTFPGATARVRPTPTMWEEAIQPYFETLAELKPHLVIVVGFDLRNHLPAGPEGVHFCNIQHPSSGNFDTAYWKGVIVTAIATARRKQVSA